MKDVHRIGSAMDHINWTIFARVPKFPFNFNEIFSLQRKKGTQLT